MKIKKLLAVAALATLGAANSYADAPVTFNEGVLTNLLSGQYNWSYALSGTSFDATYTFSLPEATGIVVKVDPYWGVAPTLVTLSSGLSSMTLDWNAGDGGYYQGYAQGIAGQLFSLHVVGTGSAGNSFNNFVTAAPVPEPETFAMLLAGLGLIGAITRRRNKTSVA